jgi:hypothetical protein
MVKRRYKQRKPKRAKPKPPKVDPFRRQKEQAERERRARENLRKAIDKRIREGDILPDIPGNIPIPGISAILKALKVPGPIAALVGAYQAAELTEDYWGPRLFDYYGQGYPDPLRPESIYVEGSPDRYIGAPDMPQKAKRKVSKANKATKRAYAFLRKKSKGKMTQKKCCDILKKAALMASRANPNTPSRIGKGRSPMKTECRKIRKSIWNTTRRN